jgi:hypothetical protein
VWVEIPTPIYKGVFMLRDIKSPQRGMRMLHFRVDGTGTASLLEGGFDGSLTDNGTGNYTISFNEAFVRVPVVVCQTKTATTVQRAVPAVGSVQVLSFAMDGTTATDADFDVIVYGSDVADQN